MHIVCEIKDLHLQISVLTNFLLMVEQGNV